MTPDTTWTEAIGAVVVISIFVLVGFLLVSGCCWLVEKVAAVLVEISKEDTR